MNQTLMAVLFTALTIPALAADPDGPLGPVNEGTTALFSLTLCDDSSTVDVDCPDGGTELSTGAISAVTYRVEDLSTGLELLDDTSVGSITNPVVIVLANTVQKIVGRCSDDGDVCDADADCGGAATCSVPRDTFDQTHILTVTWTYSGRQGTARIPFWVRNLEGYPSP